MMFRGVTLNVICTLFILGVELNGGVEFGERRGARVTLNSTVALTLGRSRCSCIWN